MTPACLLSLQMPFIKSVRIRCWLKEFFKSCPSSGPPKTKKKEPCMLKFVTQCCSQYSTQQTRKHTHLKHQRATNKVSLSHLFLHFFVCVPVVVLSTSSSQHIYTMIWNNTHNFIVSNFNFNNKRHHHHHHKRHTTRGSFNNRGSASSSVRLPSSSLVTAAAVITTTTATTAMILMYPSKCEASTNNNKKNNNNNNNINPIVAGAFAGAVARVFVAPLDVIKIRLQIQKENYSLTNAKYKGAFSAMATIAREEGIRKGLWAGTIPALCLWIPYTGIQFGMLNALNSSSSLSSSSSSSSFLNNNFVFGAVAGATATVATYPFDIIRTQLASQGIPKTYNGVFDAFFGLLRRRKLYAGLGITLIEIIPATSVQFGVYEYLNSIGKESSNTNNSSGSSGSSRSSSSNSSSFELNHFAKGFLAGSCARVAIHPLDVMKKRLQVVGLKRAASYGAAETANKAFPLVLSILKTEGVRGFYKGLVPALCKSAPSSAITFGVYEFAMQVLDSFTNSLDEQE